MESDQSFLGRFGTTFLSIVLLSLVLVPAAMAGTWASEFRTHYNRTHIDQISSAVCIGNSGAASVGIKRNVVHLCLIRYPGPICERVLVVSKTFQLMMPPLKVGCPKVIVE